MTIAIETSATPSRALPALRALQSDRAWVGVWLAFALLVATLPLALGACCAPPGRTGLGTVWFVNDFAQYESAMRQGAVRTDWLVEDQFTAEPHAPAFMFPLYVGIGKAAAVLRVPPMALERLVEVISRGLLVVALWRFATRFGQDRTAARAGFLLALFSGGLGLFVGPITSVLGVREPYTGNWSYEMNTFGLLFAAPHVPFAMAATLEVARWLRPPRTVSVARLTWIAALGTALALLHPFHVPVLAFAIGITGLIAWAEHREWRGLAVAAALGMGALPVLVPTVLTFTFDGFWGATYTAQNLLPSPRPHEVWVDMGVVLLLAAGGIWFRRGSRAAIGLVVWILVGLLAMYLPVPYQRRLAFGLHPALAVVAANTLLAIGSRMAAPRAGLVRLAVVILAVASPVMVYASVLSSVITLRPLAVYRSTPDLDAAASWLDAHATASDILLAEWDVANYVAPRTPARVFGGHPVATLDPNAKKAIVSIFYAHDGDLEIARRLGATWVIYGPDARAALPSQPPAFRQGTVCVYRVGSS